MKKKRKSAEKEKQPALPAKAALPVVIQDEDDKPFDFGGLPQRDLKKNLGCG
jgi:hypothetical protein